MATSTIKATTGAYLTVDAWGNKIQDGMCIVMRQGNTCRVYINFRATTTITTTDAIVTLPSGYRPLGNYGLAGMLISSGVVVPYYGKIGSNGVVTQQAGSTISGGLLVGEFPLA